MSDLLLELFSEEIPARMQAKAVADLKRLVTDALVENGLTYGDAAGFHTPRRLTLTLCDIPAMTARKVEERKGPRVDAPEKALDGFLRSTGLSKDQLEIRDDKKGQVYFAITTQEGRPASEVISEILDGVIRNFPWPKSMRWGSGSFRWVRPLHSIIAILYDETECTTIPLTIDGIKAGNQTFGHRFMAPEAILVNSFEDYEAKLMAAYVMLSSGARAEKIWADASNMAFAQGCEIVEDQGLLSEISCLVEWPETLMGNIVSEFSDLPTEVLQTSMKEHQKFLSIKNNKTGRIEKYVTVANRTTTDDGATILAGNSKVLFARLSDAKFFWENDLRVSKNEGMQIWTDRLSNVTFHNKLGSQKDRIERIAALSREIAPIVGANADMAEQAAMVVKADLSSEMVYEFPELQGLMGRYYAKASGLSDEIAMACEAHYSPLGPSDDVPTEPVSVAVALADKLDTLTGFWAIDEKPTGSKDPFALRRAALGVIRLVLENEARFGLKSLVLAHRALFKGKAQPEEIDGLLSFFHDRLKVYLRDQNISHDVIDACLGMPNSDDFTLLVKRVKALQAFMKTDDGKNLLQGFKRANNILSAEEKKDGVEYSLDPDVKLADNNSERALFKALDQAKKSVKSTIGSEDFEAAMRAMAGLRQPIDAFFEDTQINSDHAIIRRNRLCLLHKIRTTMLDAADFSEISG